MKIIYLGTPHITDSDFPLIREYQQRGIDVIYYISVSRYVNKGGVININIPSKTAIIPASEIPEMQQYKEYLNLDKVFIINNPNKHQRLFKGRFLWLKVLLHMRKQNADIFQASWPLTGMSKILLNLKLPKVLILHDPFMHSSGQNDKAEQERLLSIRNFDKIVLLNDSQKKAFISHYGLKEEKVIVNRFGAFTYLDYLPIPNVDVDRRYLLFFGYISGYKGLEYLCEAMPIVHKKHPEIKLLIAGGGKIYFDWTPYEHLDYIELRNHFVDLPELAGLLKGCEFSVCPYKDATQSGVIQTAFSLDVPMVVTNVGALPEVVKDGQNGLIVPPCDAKALADAITDLLDHPEKLQSMRDNIRNIWQKEMSWAPIAEKYIDCYKSLLKA